MTTGTIVPFEGCQIIGVISGSSVISRDIVRDIGAAIKNTFGGELKTYTSLLDAALDQAMDRLAQNAISVGAHGVFGIQMACPQITGGAAEVVFIGTAFRR